MIIRSSLEQIFCLTARYRSCRQRCSMKKFTGKHLCQSLFFNKVAGLTLSQVFSCGFCEISKDTFFYRTPLVAASVTKKANQCFRVIPEGHLGVFTLSNSFYISLGFKSCPDPERLHYC